MARELVASMRLKGRKDASLTKSVKDARDDMTALGTDARKAASLVQSSADRQSASLSRAERGTGRLAAGMASATRRVQGWPVGDYTGGAQSYAGRWLQM